MKNGGWRESGHRAYGIFGFGSGQRRSVRVSYGFGGSDGEPGAETGGGRQQACGLASFGDGRSLQNQARNSDYGNFCQRYLRNLPDTPVGKFSGSQFIAGGGRPGNPKLMFYSGNGGGNFLFCGSRNYCASEDCSKEAGAMALCAGGASSRHGVCTEILHLPGGEDFQSGSQACGGGPKCKF